MCDRRVQKQKHRGLTILPTTIAGVLVLGALGAGSAEASSVVPPRYRNAVQALQRNVRTGVERALKRVGTTQKQRAQIRTILARKAGAAQVLAAEAVRLQHRVAAALLAEEPDEAQLERLQTEGIELVARAATEARTGLLEAVRVMTPAQRSQLLQMWQQAWP
ncbi:hypothetical protein ACFL6C_03215 [Myxococcota bacterium]